MIIEKTVVSGNGLVFEMALPSQGGAGNFVDSPTIVAGDVKWADGEGGFNIATLPISDGKWVKVVADWSQISVSAGASNSGQASLLFSDVAGNQWSDVLVVFDIVASPNATSAELTAHDADVDAQLVAIQADLDNPDQYKADVSALATSAELTAHDADVDAQLVAIQADISPLTLTAIAEAIAKLDIADVQNDAPEHSLTGIILGILESELNGGLWVIRKTGGETFVQKSVTTSASANPVTGVS